MSKIKKERNIRVIIACVLTIIAICISIAAMIIGIVNSANDSDRVLLQILPPSLMIGAALFLLVAYFVGPKQQKEPYCQDSITFLKEHVEGQKESVKNISLLVKNTIQLEKKYTDYIQRRMKRPDEVSVIEASVAPESDIYIMTSSCLLERLNPSFRDTIINNINKGVKYRYIIPDTQKAENEFAQMVYAICADRHSDGSFKLLDVYRNSENLDFISATKRPNKYFLLTVAYYTLEDDNEKSDVIVKLPADTETEAVDPGTDAEETTQMSYSLPKGNYISAHDYFHEHYLVLEKLQQLYDSNDVDKPFYYTRAALQRRFRDGVNLDKNNPTKKKKM